MSHENDINTRRGFIRHGLNLAAGSALMSVPAIRSAAWAAGSDAPEKKEVRIGFIPLTDCSSVVMAAVQKFDEKYGIKIIPTKEASWASVRDKLVNGELDAAHVLYGLVYGVHLGVGGPQKDMNVLMTLNNNGQAITLSNQLKDKGATDGASLAKLIAKKEREYTFAQTFPTGTHAMWLYYWLAAHGINPFKDVKNITVPPPQMVANMRVGNMDGFCVGEPWNNRAIVDNIGFTAVTTQDIWVDHPEKVLGTTAEWTAKYPNTARAMTAAIIEAGKLDRRLTGEQAEDGGYGGAEVLRQYRFGRHRGAHARPLQQRPRQNLGRQERNEVLQRRRGELPLPVGRDVVHDPAQALGPAQGRPRLPRGSEEGESHRHLQASRHRRWCRGAEERHAQPQADRRRGVGRQGPEEVRRLVQGPRLIHDTEGEAK
jgi:ABC-type nitrate/sulfonate/bicarbonate transport system substrate-binding protein